MLKAAVIGVGAMGKHHARNYFELDETDLVAVCDINIKNSKDTAKLYKAKYYHDHKELIDTEDLDLVSIAVPTVAHLHVAKDFVDKGIPILIEKPIAKTSKEAKVLVDLAKKKKVVLGVGHIERFNPAILKLQELIKKREFGEILSVVVRRVGLFPPRIKDVGVVIDLAVHDLDIVTALLKKNPYSVYSKGGVSVNSEHEDHAEIFLDYGNFGCFIQVNWVTPIKIRELAVTGTKGYADLNYITQDLRLYKTKLNIKKTNKFDDFVAEYGEPEVKDMIASRHEPLKLEIKDFVSAVKGKKQPKVSGEDGLNAVVLAEAVLKSIKTSKPVKIR